MWDSIVKIYFYLFVLSLILTYVIRWYTIKKHILDMPNTRSSHSVPTPKGGGLAITIVFYIGLLYFQAEIENRLLYALLSAIPIIVVSFIDDIIMISSKIRLLVQSVATIMALYFLGGVGYLDFLLFEVNGIWVNIIAFFTIIWITNLYNFLDGIDGYAGAEAILVGLGIFIFFQNPLGLVVIAASLGFLVFNWHKASIFMGDVGSATLGFIFAIFVFYDTSEGNIYLWMVLLSLFWFDATLTLIRRYKNGEIITEAHKKHAYQRLVQSGWSHSKVVWASIIYNLVFFVLLYLIDNLLIVFVMNILTLYSIIKLIDKKKSFRE